jgi:transcriptional regulator
MLILSDNQDITRAGLQWLCSEMKHNDIAFAADKAALAKLLDEQEQAVVVLDYTLFDFASFDELLIWQQRFQSVQWLLFSEMLTSDFVRVVVASGPRFGLILKDAPLPQIRQALHDALRGEPYHYAPLVQMADEQWQEVERVKLTKTEMEVLRDIALGLTTKEIAEKRFSSFHTINTHRKNIFRKLNVNNVHEATKYALRAGMVDAAEYYI